MNTWRSTVATALSGILHILSLDAARMVSKMLHALTFCTFSTFKVDGVSCQHL
jgi:hypothetical protein